MSSLQYKSVFLSCSLSTKMFWEALFAFVYVDGSAAEYIQIQELSGHTMLFTFIGNNLVRLINLATFPPHFST